MRRIWLCADDYGIAPGVNAAIRDLAARGRLNATSVMVVAPSLDREAIEALKLLREPPCRLSIGLHVTLTAPFRPLTGGYRPVREAQAFGAADSPSPCGEGVAAGNAVAQSRTGRGAFLPLAATLLRALTLQLHPRSLSAEVAAQFAAFERAFGRPPDFVDGHQHVHLFPQIRDAVLETTRERAPGAWVRQCGRVGPRGLLDLKPMLLDALSRSFRRRARALSLATNPAFSGAYRFEPNADYARLFPDFLAGLPDGGVVMCHPGLVDAELERLDPLTRLREREYAYLGGDEFAAALGRAEIQLI